MTQTNKHINDIIDHVTTCIKDNSYAGAYHWFKLLFNIRGIEIVIVNGCVSWRRVGESSKEVLNAEAVQYIRNAINRCNAIKGRAKNNILEIEDLNRGLRNLIEI